MENKWRRKKMILWDVLWLAIQVTRGGEQMEEEEDDTLGCVVASDSGGTPKRICECCGARVTTSQTLIDCRDTTQVDLVAQLVVVEYHKEGLEPLILTIEEAVERFNFLEDSPLYKVKQVGDFSKGMVEEIIRFFLYW